VSRGRLRPFSDVLVRDRGVGDDREQVVEQHLAVLAAAGALGQRLGHPPPGPALPTRHGLIEQLPTSSRTSTADWASSVSRGRAALLTV